MTDILGVISPADETRKAEIENTKQEQLREQKEGRNEWKDGLASESESVVRLPYSPRPFEHDGMDEVWVEVRC